MTGRAVERTRGTARTSNPDSLLGGHEQRATIVRALAMQPKIMLLDDSPSNARTQQFLQRIIEAAGRL